MKRKITRLTKPSRANLAIALRDIHFNRGVTAKVEMYLLLSGLITTGANNVKILSKQGVDTLYDLETHGF